ncbi:MAG: DnaJ domain-containing protein [Chloroflexi bacterium]|nr:DnaJ domain-containing protein [Chloroflexota bacterium]
MSNVNANANEDYYKILQVDPSAEPEVITAAYRRLAVKYHPDNNRSPDATPRMQKINEAYAILSDASQRAVYDRTRRNGAVYRQSAPGADQTARRAEQRTVQEAEAEWHRAKRAAEDGWKRAMREADVDRDRVLREAEDAWNRAKRAAEETWKRAAREADIERDKALREADDAWNRARRTTQMPTSRG